MVSAYNTQKLEACNNLRRFIKGSIYKSADIESIPSRERQDIEQGVSVSVSVSGFVSHLQLTHPKKKIRSQFSCSIQPWLRHEAAIIKIIADIVFNFFIWKDSEVWLMPNKIKIKIKIKIIRERKRGGKKEWHIESQRL